MGHATETKVSIRSLSPSDAAGYDYPEHQVQFRNTPYSSADFQPRSTNPAQTEEDGASTDRRCRHTDATTPLSRQ